MFHLNFLRRCYGKRIYLFFVLILLDIVTTFYSGGIDHLLTRHMFISYDLVSGFANVLFWIILFVPEAVDIIQERSSFGVSIFCRITRTQYLIMKIKALFLYCASFFSISMIISLAVGATSGYKMGSVISITREYIILVLLSYALLMLVNLMGWIFNSSYAMAVIYAVLIAVIQIPNLQEYFSIMMLVETFPWSVWALTICSALNILLVLLAIKHKDFIGMKKGMSI